MTDLSSNYVGIVPATNESITISTGGSITRVQVKVTYPRLDGESGLAFHDADAYGIDEWGLHIFSGQKRIASYRQWATVDIITATAVQPLTPFVKPLDYPFTNPNPFPSNPFSINPVWVGPTC